MFLKLKALLYISGLRQYLQGQKKKSSLDSDKIIWHGKLLCNEQGASSIGVVITVFFLFLLILLPMNLFVQELSLYRISNHKVQMATEMTCFDMVLRLDAEALSAANLVMNGQLVPLFEMDLKAHLMRNEAMAIDVSDLAVALETDRHPYRLHVKFKYPYEPQLFFMGHIVKMVDVELSYELPLNN